MDKQWGFATKAIHGGKSPDAHQSVVPPIYQTATFYYETAEDGARLGQEIPPGYIYSRWGNPTTRVLEDKIALLEGAEEALATASGMAAISTAVLASVKRGEHVIAHRALYQATYQLFTEILPAFGVETTLLDEPDPESFERALRPTTRLLYLETPNNPLLGITDIAAIVALARGHGARTIADNTFATPYNQRPLTLGVDVVVHSATKALGGHHDVTAGVLAGSSAFMAQARKWLRIFGGTIDPFGAWLVIRGLQTLGLRVERQNANALRLAGVLAAHPNVAQVHYPGLRAHPGHEIARRQMQGFGSMMSIEVRGGLQGGIRTFEALRVATRAVSLGGVSTLVTHPASTTSVQIPKPVREAAGISDGLIRLSVGIEEIEDLIRDFEDALKRV